MLWNDYERTPKDLNPFSMGPLFPLKLFYPANKFQAGTVFYHYGGGRRYVVYEQMNSKVENVKLSPYARVLFGMYLWETQGIELTPSMRASYINGDCLDDRIENYEILTQSQVNRKYKKDYDRRAVVICPVCGTHFLRAPTTCQLHSDHLRTVLCCSNKCIFQFASLTRPKEEFGDVIELISANQIYKIVRVWKNEKRIEDEKILNTAMLDFDLPKMVRRQITLPSVNIIFNDVNLLLEDPRFF